MALYSSHRLVGQASTQPRQPQVSRLRTLFNYCCPELHLFSMCLPAYLRRDHLHYLERYTS
jgi:hypothetical protein